MELMTFIIMFTLMMIASRLRDIREALYIIKDK